MLDWSAGSTITTVPHLTYAAAFVSALFVGLSLHYRKIVENEFYGFPDEWFPSVSATIGDRYPERNIFMFFIATTTGTAPSVIRLSPI